MFLNLGSLKEAFLRSLTSKKHEFNSTVVNFQDIDLCWEFQSHSSPNQVNFSVYELEFIVPLLWICLNGNAHLGLQQIHNSWPSMPFHLVLVLPQPLRPTPSHYVIMCRHLLMQYYHSVNVKIAAERDSSIHSGSGSLVWFHFTDNVAACSHTGT